LAYWKLRQRVEAFRAALGKEKKEIPQEIIDVEEQIERQKAKIRMLEAKGASSELISIELSRLNGLEVQYRYLVKKYGL